MLAWGVLGGGVVTAQFKVGVAGTPLKQVAHTARDVARYRGFARVDFFLTPSGKLVFNEVNTIPGLTAHSRFPKMLEAAGIPLEDAVTQAIEEALEP